VSADLGVTRANDCDSKCDWGSRREELECSSACLSAFGVSTAGLIYIESMLKLSHLFLSQEN
jgi:hypothetical protein